MKPERVREILGELAGASSMCWDPRPTGVFDATKASKYVDEAFELLLKEGLGKVIEQLQAIVADVKEHHRPAPESE